MTTASDRCHVCERAADDSNSAHCSLCGRRFHLVLTNASEGASAPADAAGGEAGGQDAAAKDCGAVWIDDSTMALEFGCERCLAEQRGEASPSEAGDESAGPAEPAPGERGSARARKQTGSARDVVRRKRG